MNDCGGKEVCWAGPEPERRWQCRQAIEGASLGLEEDTAVWTTLEGAPLIAARKVGRGVVATLGCHPSAARDAVGAATLLLRQKRLQCTQATTRYTGAEALCCQAASSILTAKGCSSLRTIRSSPASQPSPVSSKMPGSNMASHADIPLSTPHRRASRRRRPSIVVVYGTPANNLGDDAMLTAVVRDIQTIEPEAEVTVLAESPEYCGPLADQLNAPIEESLQQLCVVATLSWEAKGVEAVEVRVGSPDGALLSRGGAAGNATTGRWVQGRYAILSCRT